MDIQSRASNIPEPIALIYRQAYASFDHVDDPRLKRALIGVMRAVENDFGLANNEADDDARMSCLG